MEELKYYINKNDKLSCLRFKIKNRHYLLDGPSIRLTTQGKRKDLIPVKLSKFEFYDCSKIEVNCNPIRDIQSGLFTKREYKLEQSNVMTLNSNKLFRFDCKVISHQSVLNKPYFKVDGLLYRLFEKGLQKSSLILNFDNRNISCVYISLAYFEVKEY